MAFSLPMLSMSLCRRRYIGLVALGPCLMMIYKACIMKVFIMLKMHSKRTVCASIASLFNSHPGDPSKVVRA